MKGRRRAGAEAATAFARGAVTSGLLAALQGNRTGTASGTAVLRLALQGGAALAAGTAAADALRQREPAAALLAVAAGAAGVIAAERLLRPARPTPVLPPPGRVPADQETVNG